MSFFSPVHGGSAVIPYQLSKELAKRGHEVTIYTSDYKLSEEWTKSAQELQIKVFSFRTWLNWVKVQMTPGILKQAKDEVKHFDVIHMHNYRTFQNIVVRHYAKKYGVPYVLLAGGSVLPFFAKQGLKRVFDMLFGYRILRDAAKAIAGCETEVNEYKEMRVNEDKITLISPAYAIEEFSQLPPSGRFRHKFNIKEEHIVLFLGRIHQIKGIDFLVESFHELAQERDDVILVIAGPDDGYRHALESLIKKLNLSSRVLFTGFLDGEDKLSALGDAAMLVQTSIYERGPGSPFEAIMCNTPIIVTKNTGCGDIVVEIDAGYLVEYGNVNELKNMMQRILDDPTEALDKTQKAKQYIRENYSYERKTEEYERLYKSVIEQRRVG